jgi:hypothetical protein
MPSDLRLRSILKVIRTSKPGTYPGALAERLASALTSNKGEREMLIEILACIGVLVPASTDRPNRGNSDWVRYGYDTRAVARWFGAK